MGRGTNNELRGVVLDSRTQFTLHQFCDACGVQRELIVTMVTEGVIEPVEPRGEDWIFSGRELVRAQRALRLVNDLDINWPGAALALDLIEELEALRAVR